MTYKELKKLTARKQLPIAGQNEHGENIIIAHCIDEQKNKYYKLTTAQSNGWTRHNHIYENGDTEEFYTK